MATVNAVKLPTDAQYRAVIDALQAAHDAVEDLAVPLKGVGETVKPTQLATAADVGLLWSFTDNLRGYVEDLNRFAGQLEVGLSGVETARGG